MRKPLAILSLMFFLVLIIPPLAGAYGPEDIVPIDPDCNRCSEVQSWDYSFEYNQWGLGLITAQEDYNGYCWYGYIFDPVCGEGDFWYGGIGMELLIGTGWSGVGNTYYQQGCTPSCAPGVHTVDYELNNISQPGEFRIHFDAGRHNDAGSGCSERCDWYISMTVPSCVGIDADGDGYTACVDTEDNDPDRNPGAVEECDGIDNDLDGEIDEDSDGDGFAACVDCDNGDPDTYPGAPEICDGLKNDCSAPTLSIEEEDRDGDGFIGCMDCDDDNNTVYPGAPERCDGLINDCDLWGTPGIDPDFGTVCTITDRNLGDPTCGLSPTKNPVNAATGNMHTPPKEEITVRGVKHDISLSRSYNSQATYDGPLGYGWSHS